MALETSLGAATGFIPGARVAGITAGRNSYNAILRQMTTKIENGAISSVTPQTAAKMLELPRLCGPFRASGNFPQRMAPLKVGGRILAQR